MGKQASGRIAEAAREMGSFLAKFALWSRIIGGAWRNKDFRLLGIFRVGPGLLLASIGLFILAGAILAVRKDGF